MPRTPRFDFPGARHHVMNRCIRREAMFANDAQCASFLDVLADVPRRFGAKIHGFALMPNHYHLLVEVPRGNLSAVMKYIGGVFTQAYNRANQHDGPVFRGRYRSRLVEDDAYWMHLLAYLHLNPVNLHLAQRPQEYLWTSHNAYVHADQAPDWLTRDEMLRLFGSSKDITQYLSNMRAKRLKPPPGFDAERLWGSPATASRPAAPEPPCRTADQALADVAAVTGMPVGDVRRLSRGRTPNREAWLTVWWLSRGARLNQSQVGEQMGVTRARISQLLTKARRLAVEDAAFREWQQRLNLLLESEG